MPATDITMPTTFMFDKQKVRVIVKPRDDPWWVLADVCKACGISNSRMVADRLDEDGVSTADIIDSLGRTQKVTVINESGLYDVIFDSRKPEARRFRKWVTSEVLPSIRKHGAYMTPDTIERALLNPDFVIRLAQQLKQAREETRAATIRARKAEEHAAELEEKGATYDAFVNTPDLVRVREAAKYLQSAGVDVREQELFAYMVEIKWISRDSHGHYHAYAKHVAANHVREVMPDHRLLRKNGTQFEVAPSIRLTREGVIDLYRRLSSDGGIIKPELGMLSAAEQWVVDEVAEHGFAVTGRNPFVGDNDRYPSLGRLGLRSATRRIGGRVVRVAVPRG